MSIFTISVAVILALSFLAMLIALIITYTVSKNISDKDENALKASRYIQIAGLTLLLIGGIMAIWTAYSPLSRKAYSMLTQENNNAIAGYGQQAMNLYGKFNKE
jgi:heme/copper-type cytochrome/quinol oxidase subunit 1